MSRGTRLVGTVTAAMLLCSSIAMPAAADDNANADGSAAGLSSSEIANIVNGNTSTNTDTQSDTDKNQTQQAEDVLNASADADERIAGGQNSSESTGNNADADSSADKSAKAAKATAVADTSSLKALLESTKESNLKPLASGYRSDDSGTAPYDRWESNADDIKALNEARDAAQKVVDNAAATEADITAAAEALQTAFDSVRFIYHYTGITGTNGARMFDNNGNLIQAHGAGIVKAKTSTLAKTDRDLDKNEDGYIYIWCGEDKTDRLVAHGVRIYYSDDLLNWTDKGLGFQTYLGDADLQNKLNGADEVYQKYYNVKNIESDPDYTNIYGKDFSTFANDSSNYNISSAQDALDKLLWDLKALYGDGSNATKTSCVFERPKMAYNESTGRWVIWFHADGPKYGNEDTATYSKAKAGVAVSTTGDPAGPYKYLGSFRMSPGSNTSNPGMARDMNLYIDEGKDENGDGVDDAYLIYASNENRDLTISLLDSTYTKLAVPVAEQKQGTSVKDGDTYNIIATNSKESPAPVKWKGHYYFIYSHTTGWAPNENEYTKSEGDNIMGNYHEIGTPFVDGDGYEQSHTNSFYTQSSSIIPVDAEKGLFIYWGDRWFNPDTGNDISQSRYVMTPMQMVNGEMRVLPAADWTLDELNQYEAVDVITKLPTTATSVSELLAELPNKLEIQRGGETGTVTTPVTWDTYFGEDQPAGEVTLTGRLTELNNITVSVTATIYPKNTYLYIDAGSDPNNESDYFTALKAASKGIASRQEHSDQAYSAASGWGLVSTMGENGDAQVYGTDSNDVYETGLYANAGKSIVYQADLEPGVYTVQAGMKDWWAQWNDRTVKFAVTNGNEELGSASVNLKNGQQSTSAITFTLDKAASIQFVVSNAGTSLDPVLSWISVSKADANDIQSVQAVDGTVAFLDGTTPELPKQVTVTTVGGATEQRDVTWQTSHVSKLKAYAPTEVQGIVTGTTLPATATVQKIEKDLDYFIDVNGGDSSATYVSAAKLTEGGLTNAKADQTFDEATGWGNASTNYGSQNAGNANPYQSGIYAGANGSAGTLSYKLTLAPGTHAVSLGMHDWWSQTRPTTVTYSYDGLSVEQELASASVNSGQVIASGDITIPAGEAKVVTFTLASSTGTGPVLSWVSATKATDVPEPIDPTPVSVAEVTATAKAGEAPTLPENVAVTYSDDSTKDVKVTWDTHDWAAEKAAGTVTLGGDLEGIDAATLRAKAVVTLTAPDVDPTPVNEVPVITGITDVSITEGTAFDALAGVTASDKEDGDLTSRIAVTGSVDATKVGAYQLTYTVSDSQGATATVVRTVTVKAKGGSGEEGKPTQPGNTAKPGNTNKPTANGAAPLSNTGAAVTAIAGVVVVLAVAAGALLAIRKRRA